MAEMKEGAESEVAAAPGPKMAGWVVPVAVALIGAVTTIAVALINRPSAPSSSPPPAPSQPAGPSQPLAAPQTATPSSPPAASAAAGPGAEQLASAQPLSNGRYLSRWKVTTGATHPEDVDVGVGGDANIIDFVARGPQGKQLFIDTALQTAASGHWIVKGAPRVFDVIVQAEAKVPLRLSVVPR